MEELFFPSPTSSSNAVTASNNSTSCQKRSSSIVSSCSMKLEEFDELEEEGEQGSDNDENHHSDDNHHHPSSSNNNSSMMEKGVQRQLATVKEQKERLIKEIVENERVGMDIQARLEARLTARDLEKYTVYLAEMEKVCFGFESILYFSLNQL